MIHCKKCLTVFTNSVGSGTVLCNGCQAEYDADPDAYIEFGQHPAGESRWKEELERAAND